MYKALVLMTTLGLTTNAAIANTCESQSATLQAEYKIHTHSANSDKTKLLNLWRQPNVVAHEYPQTRITETWEHVQQRLIKPTRYFDAHNRAIEYQPGESVHGKTKPAGAIAINFSVTACLPVWNQVKRSAKVVSGAKHLR